MFQNIIKQPPMRSLNNKRPTLQEHLCSASAVSNHDTCAETSVTVYLISPVTSIIRLMRHHRIVIHRLFNFNCSYYRTSECCRLRAAKCNGRCASFKRTFINDTISEATILLFCFGWYWFNNIISFHRISILIIIAYIYTFSTVICS